MQQFGLLQVWGLLDVDVPPWTNPRLRTFSTGESVGVLPGSISASWQTSPHVVSLWLIGCETSTVWLLASQRYS